MRELDAALLGNLGNPHITKIHIVAAVDDEEHNEDEGDNGKELLRPVTLDFLAKRGFQLPQKARKDKRLVFLASSSGRPTVRSMIRYANEKLCPGSIMVS